MNLRHKDPPAEIEVEMKIIGFIAGEYVSVVTRVTMAEGDSPAALLCSSRDAGIISPSLYTQIHHNRKWFVMQRNGEVLPPKDFTRAKLTQSDSVLFFSIVTGG
ncbi:MAG: hypothetical protein EPN93_01875 [Spirochaetes bacterium]|nr:MAG: hypothetical protein EPN93_01875 [Spirochaetota bacterium]